MQNEEDHTTKDLSIHFFDILMHSGTVYNVLASVTIERENAYPFAKSILAGWNC